MQDFTRKISILVDTQNEKWQSVNTVAHISAYLGNKMEAPFDTGDSFATADGLSYPRNSQFPIIVLGANQEQLRALIPTVRGSGLQYLAFTREMIETTDDAEIESILAKKKADEVEIFGIGVFGTKEEVNALTKGFGLWKI